MNSLKNRVQLIGRLGMDPEVKNLESGKKLARFSVATNDVFYSKDGDKQENTQWHNVIAWGKTAELAEKYFEKGSQVCLEGRLNNRSYEDKNGGVKYITEVIANEFAFLGAKRA